MMMNAVEFMTKFERDCLAFYEAVGKQTTDPEVREIYELLADAQKRHLVRLEEIQASRGLIEAESELLDRTAPLDFDFNRLLVDHELVRAMKNDRDGFEHVVKAEEDVIKLFEGMARAEKREETRQMLAMLAADEKEHLEEIEGIYDFIERPHCYLEWGEFSNLKPL
jgi:rubrerythrin